MAKTQTLGVRLAPAERVAIERAAVADDRAASALVRKIVVEWLVKGGWLKGVKK